MLTYKHIFKYFQVNAGTLLDFFNQLSKTPGPGGFSDSIEKVRKSKILRIV